MLISKVTRVLMNEYLKKEDFERVPEPDPLMSTQDQILAFTEAGQQSGILRSLYCYHSFHATQTIRGAKTVLDLGCGSGIFLLQMAALNPQTNFYGLDLSEPMLERAKLIAEEQNIKNVTFIHKDMSKLNDWSNQSIDAVISLQAFHHLPNIESLEQTFAEVARVLKPAGAIYLQDLLKPKRSESTILLSEADPHVPPATRKDGEHSLRAAFRLKDYERLCEKYFTHRAQLFNTWPLCLYMVIKTPNRSIEVDARKSISASKAKLDREAKEFYRVLAVSHWLGGLS